MEEKIYKAVQEVLSQQEQEQQTNEVLVKLDEVKEEICDEVHDVLGLTLVFIALFAGFVLLSHSSLEDDIKKLWKKLKKSDENE